MKAKILGLLAVGLLAGPMAAHAGIINFNMSTLSPVPSYDSVVLDLNLSGEYGGVTCMIYGGLNLTGGFVDGCALPTPMTFTKAGILDGTFSLFFSSVDYMVDGLPFVVGIKNGVKTAMLFADGSVRTSVPEPGLLGLLCCGLAALGVRRSRRATRA